jgi:putative mRNA 3-end processing factor
MRKFSHLLCPSPAGLYCRAGDFHIDPVQPVARAVITHGHGDHARSGHDSVVATPQTLAIMACRHGEDFAVRRDALDYGGSLVRDGVTVRLAPAGHILGSAQVVLSWRGMTAVVSGDYKRRRDPTCRAFEPVRCDLFVSEATFGLPVFVHPPDHEEVAKLLQSVRQFPGRTHLVGVYALGKAQRLIRLLREAGYGDTLYVHGALASLNALYERHGIALGPLAPATEAGKDLAGAIVLAPPSAIADRW